MKRNSKLLAAFLAVMLLLTLLPVGAAAAEDSVYVLEGANLLAFAAGEKADGQTDTAEYFTIHWSAKSKVDASSKTWEDGYTSDQRISFGGKTDIDGENTKNAISITTSGAATVKIWWVQGGDDHRQVGIYDEAGTLLTQSDDQTAAKNDPVYSSLTIDAAGTYYIGNVINQNPIFKVEVVEQSSQEIPPTGDLSQMYALMLLMTLSLAAVVLFGKKVVR